MTGEDAQYSATPQLTMRGVGAVVVVIALSLLALSMASNTEAHAQKRTEVEAQRGAKIEGSATLYDGDTLYIKIRPWGFDAPELSPRRRCGDVNPAHQAREALQNLIKNGKTVTCTHTGVRDDDNRIVATCSVGAVDVGDHLVGLGWARDWPQYSGGRYCAKEREARAARRGIWGLNNCPADLWNGRDYTNPKTRAVCE